jgi:ElaB/YqjD/DUF883 family membrane-anchored ribosome-binding protein
MINPGEDEFTQDQPVGSTPFNEGEKLKQSEERRMGASQRLSRNATETWEQSQENATLARRGTDYFLRENPIPTIIGALAVGLAIGWALRYATAHEEKEVQARSRLGDLNWGFFSLPFLWPFFKSVRERYEDSADAVKGRVDQLKKIDVERYTKPIRKRWKAWTK